MAKNDEMNYGLIMQLNHHSHKKMVGCIGRTQINRWPCFQSACMIAPFFGRRILRGWGVCGLPDLAFHSISGKTYRSSGRQEKAKLISWIQNSCSRKKEVEGKGAVKLGTGRPCASLLGFLHQRTQDGLEQKNFVLSQSEDWKSKSQGVHKAMLPLKVKRKE